MRVVWLLDLIPKAQRTEAKLDRWGLTKQEALRGQGSPRRSLWTQS